MYYDDYDDDGGDPRRWKVIGGAAAVAVLGAIALWQLRSDGGSDDGADAVTVESTVAPTSALDVTRSTTRAATTSTSLVASAPPVPGSTSTRSTASSTASSSTASSSTASSSSGTSSGGTSSRSASSGPTSGSDPTPPTTAGAATPSVGYPTNPDGTPLPIVVIFDTDTITISGQVPSEAARERLSTLAVANSQFPDAEVVDNMIVNPAVPISVGVRVIELNSARFPEGSAEILPAHALELDRVVNIMKALPNISVLVIGHADQRGSEATNFAISDERARAVLNYLLYLGVSPTRLASRAAGESDLLTVAEDDQALALNRRTEFVFSGLLIE